MSKGISQLCPFKPAFLFHETVIMRHHHYWLKFLLLDFFVKTKTRNQMKCGKLSSEKFEKFILINRCNPACFRFVSVKLEPRFLYLDRYLSALRATAKDEWILIISLQPRLLLCGGRKNVQKLANPIIFPSLQQSWSTIPTDSSCQQRITWQNGILCIQYMLCYRHFYLNSWDSLNKEEILFSSKKYICSITPKRKSFNIDGFPFVLFCKFGPKILFSIYYYLLS